MIYKTVSLKRPLLLIILMLAVITLFLLKACRFISPDPDQEIGQVTATATATATPTPVPYTHHILQNGDSIYSVLTAAGVQPSLVHKMIGDCQSNYDLTQVGAGRMLSYRFQRDQFSDLIYSVDEEHNLVANYNVDVFQCKLETIDFELQDKVYEGTITSCLWESAIEAGIEPQTLMELASIYDWEIDFNTEFRKNDRFSVLVETKYLDGIFHHFGQILAANIVVAQKDHIATFYKSPDGRTDYYDQEGNCLRKNFLKAPLRYSRISSGYSSRRRHPILKIVRPHWGIDYAVPSGTPIRAIGDGTLTFVGWKSGYGRYIRMKHGSTPYQSGYGHLRSYAKGIKKNVKVKQGQIIGYVGATGLATGPHLDFRVYYHGKPINPLKIKTTPARKISTEELPTFRNLTQLRIAQLTELEPSQALPSTLIKSGPLLGNASQSSSEVEIPEGN